MAVSLSNALGQLAKMQRQTKAARSKAMTAKESTEERIEYVYNSALRFGAAAAAGYADARIDDTMGGLTPSELGGLALGGLSMTGVLGKATKSTRSLAEGALCGAFYRRAFVMGGGSATAPALSASAEVSGHIGAAEESEILVALQEEQAAGLADAASLVD